MVDQLLVIGDNTFGSCLYDHLHIYVTKKIKLVINLIKCQNYELEKSLKQLF